ncbi:unnamed protein product [Nesidiocoris tenuis]|uniref:Uncharacterized protein n=1 Tax=Nesidiocoris tenuis TaxID=355587 RepID=A0A6H5HNF6_9HEMI|nr:unnamed protein product [Nesidiocoris tenuis]
MVKEFFKGHYVPVNGRNRPSGNMNGRRWDVLVQGRSPASDSHKLRPPSPTGTSLL